MARCRSDREGGRFGVRCAGSQVKSFGQNVPRIVEQDAPDPRVGAQRHTRRRSDVEGALHGVLLGCHAAHPYLRDTPSARVINLASSAAFYGQAALASYSASKFFVRGLTESLNIEWQAQDIRVMDLMPLFVQTGLLDGNQPLSLRRLGVHLQPEDVAQVLWQAAQCPRWSRVHWPVGLHARMLYKVMAFTPDWLNRFIARQIAT